jgi:ligand-binding sensor domain-containing protein/signal transduction histidine kinase
VPLRFSRRLRAVLLFFTAPCLLAEYPPVKSWTSADGLAGDSEIGILMQDSRGYLWICGALGLSRFDGHTFRNYNKADGMPPGFVSVALETKDGTLWFGSSRGLVRYVPDAGAPQRFTAYPFTAPGGIEIRTIHSLAEDPRGGLWIGTPRGLFHADPSRGEMHARQVIGFEEPGGKEPPGIGRIETLLVDSHGVLWAGTHYSGLYRILPGETNRSEYRIEHYTVANGLPSNVAGSLLEDHLGRIWFATPHGLFQLSSTPLPDETIVQQFVDTSYGLSENTLNALAETADGHLWIGSMKGLAEFDGRRLRTWTTANGLSDNYIFSLLADRQGNLWAGTRSAGIMRITRNGFTTYRESDGLGPDGQIGVVTEAHGALLAVTALREQFPIHVWDGRRFNTILPRFPDKRMTFGWGAGQKLIQDHLGNWWVGTYDGLCRFPRAGSVNELSGRAPERCYTTRDGLPGDNVIALFEDSTGDIWIGAAFRDQRSGPGRWKRRDERIEDFSRVFGVPIPVASFLQDPSGAVWMGYGNGTLVRFQNDHFTRFAESDGVPPGYIHLYLDDSGSVWGAADLGGVFRLEKRDTDHPQFTRFTSENGLSSDYAFTVTSDLSGRIYVGTRRGVDRINPSTGQISHLTTADGLANNLVLTAFRDSHGDLWFGTQNGLSKLTVSRSPAAPPPIVRITEIRVDDRPAPLSDLGETSVETVELHARRSHVQISFSGINLDSDLRFRYKLEGPNSEWSQPGAQQSVVFPGLPDGKYRFLVQALNSDDAASAPATVSLNVLPPFWLRWWFILIAVAAVAAAVWQWQRLRVERLLELERLRTRIATDLHDDIGTSLSHISVLSELARRKIGDSEYLSQITGISQEAAAAIGDVVWAINPQRDSLNDLVLRMRRFAADVLNTRNIEVRFSAPDSEGARKLNSDFRRQLYLAFKEAINNVARHAQATFVEIDLRVDRASVALEIRDNGRGFDFGQVSTGNGLTSLRGRAQLLKGTFSVESGEGKGTRLKFRVPL